MTSSIIWVLSMFVSIDEALRWSALMRCTLIIKGASINAMCGKPRRSTRNLLLLGLSPQESRQQAECIFKYASSLSDPVCVQYLHAKYFFMSKIEDILHAIGTPTNRDYSCVVRSYVGDTVTRRRMRVELRCMTKDVKEIERDVHKALDVVHHRAISELELKLIDVGLLTSR